MSPQSINLPYSNRIPYNVLAVICTTLSIWLLLNDENTVALGRQVLSTSLRIFDHFKLIADLNCSIQVVVWPGQASVHGWSMIMAIHISRLTYNLVENGSFYLKKTNSRNYAHTRLVLLGFQHDESMKLDTWSIHVTHKTCNNDQTKLLNFNHQKR